MALQSKGWKLPSSCNICTSCTAMGPLTIHCSCSSCVTLKCRDYPTCSKRRAVTHCSIPPRNRGQGTGVHEEKWAKPIPPLTYTLAMWINSPMPKPNPDPNPHPPKQMFEQSCLVYVHYIDIHCIMIYCVWRYTVWLPICWYECQTASCMYTLKSKHSCTNMMISCTIIVLNLLPYRGALDHSIFYN